MAELYATGLIVRTIWADQKRDTFRLFVPAEKAEQEEDVNKKKAEEFDWRELALKGDKPVGIVHYKKRSKNSDGSGSEEIDGGEDSE